VALATLTVKVAEPPEVIEVGLAETVIVGGGFEVTVTVTLAEVFPPAPVAVAE
jgi:hypothetical protein